MASQRARCHEAACFELPWRGKWRRAGTPTPRGRRSPGKSYRLSRGGGGSGIRPRRERAEANRPRSERAEPGKRPHVERAGLSEPHPEQAGSDLLQCSIGARKLHECSIGASTCPAGVATCPTGYVSNFGEGAASIGPPVGPRDSKMQEAKCTYPFAQVHLALGLREQSSDATDGVELALCELEHNGSPLSTGKG